MSVENEVIDRCRTRVGKALGQSWRLDALIGLGGLGAVYAGSHKNGLVAAIKVLHPAIAATPEARAGFPREVVVANRARHPSTVAVLGEEADPQIGAFLVVELLLGETLDARARGAGGRLPIGQALAIADQVLGALESIHKHGIVHRDLRPRKLFLTNKGALKLLDLGLGALREQVEPRARIARERAAFLSPEQALGRFAEVDARTDVWALGATLFWMLAGTTVFEGETASMLLGSAATRAARSLGRLRPDLPAGLIRLVDSALEREKSRRFASASAMRAELAKVRAELEPPSSRGPVSGPPPTTRRSTLEDLTPSQRGDPPPTARLRGDTPPALRKAAPTLRPPPETASPAAALGMSRAPSTELSSRRAGEAAARPAPPVGAPASADVPPTMPPPPLAKEQPAPPSSRAQVTVASTRGDIVDAEPSRSAGGRRGRPPGGTRRPSDRRLPIRSRRRSEAGSPSPPPRAAGSRRTFRPGACPRSSRRRRPAARVRAPPSRPARRCRPSRLRRAGRRRRRARSARRSRGACSTGRPRPARAWSRSSPRRSSSATCRASSRARSSTGRSTPRSCATWRAPSR
ncbi:MAG: protein kinase [Byssovorax sp.]